MRLQLCLLLPLLPICLTVQMIEFWGEIHQSSTPSESTTVWKTCRDQCYYENSCLAVREVDQVKNCQLFRFGQISSVKLSDSESGLRIAIKKNIATCPATYDDMLDIISSDEDYSNDTLDYSYKMLLTKTPEVLWNIEVDYFFECPVGSFISIRGNIRVCIEVIKFNTTTASGDRELAKTFCSYDPRLGLTGPYLDAERVVIVAKARQLDSCPGYSYCNYWIDGDRVNNTDFSVTDNTLNGTSGYQWGVTQSEIETHKEKSCLYVERVRQADKGKIVIGSCDHNIKNGSWVMRGAVCRATPIYSFPQ